MENAKTVKHGRLWLCSSSLFLESSSHIHRFMLKDLVQEPVLEGESLVLVSKEVRGCLR